VSQNTAQPVEEFPVNGVHVQRGDVLVTVKFHVVSTIALGEMIFTP
jgi:hypothetical protein